jgi:hypothetical protein
VGKPRVETPATPLKERTMKQALWNVVTNLKVMVLCIVVSQLIVIVRMLA